MPIVKGELRVGVWGGRRREEVIKGGVRGRRRRMHAG